MKHSKKLEIQVPEEHKLVNQLRIILKLADIGAYDIHGRVRDLSGRVVNGSDVSHLLLHCVNPQGPIHGESEFIAQLRRANIDPTWITNVGMRRELETPKAIKQTFPTTPLITDFVHGDVPEERPTTPPMPILHPISPRPHKRSKSALEAPTKRRRLLPELNKNVQWEIPDDG